jgi:hypothetical protein
MIPGLPIACGGGGETDARPLAGRFLDGPVEGLEWETPSGTGTTDAAGTFFYRPGERIDFWVGDIWLGQAPAAPLLTPLDLVPGGADLDHPVAINLARFLQTLDADGFPENGIRISAPVHEAAEALDIDFSLAVDIFDRTPALTALLAAAGADGAFSGPGPPEVVSAESAARHLADTLAGLAGSGGDANGGGGSNGASGGGDGSNGADGGSGDAGG